MHSSVNKIIINIVWQQPKFKTISIVLAWWTLSQFSNWYWVLDKNHLKKIQSLYKIIKK